MFFKVGDKVKLKPTTGYWADFYEGILFVTCHPKESFPVVFRNNNFYNADLHFLMASDDQFDLVRVNINRENVQMRLP